MAPDLTTENSQILNTKDAVPTGLANRILSRHRWHPDRCATYNSDAAIQCCSHCQQSYSRSSSVIRRLQLTIVNDETVTMRIRTESVSEIKSPGCHCLFLLPSASSPRYWKVLQLGRFPLKHSQLAAVVSDGVMTVGAWPTIVVLVAT